MNTLKKLREDFNKARYRGGKIAPLSRADMFRIVPVLKFVGRDKTVLDIGCGNGCISELISRNNNEVYGVDISDNALEVARSRGIKASRLDIECEKLPFPDSRFDAVVCAEIIEHIFDTDGFLDEIKRVLKPGASLIITTPNLATLGRRLLLSLGMNPHIEVSLDPLASGHIRYFVKGTLVYLLQAHGFEVVAVTSDIVNFNGRGSLYSAMIPKIFPTLGRTLIVKAESLKK
jgi:methionine biosynthesis protein MetW